MGTEEKKKKAENIRKKVGVNGFDFHQSARPRGLLALSQCSESGARPCLALGDLLCV